MIDYILRSNIINFALVVAFFIWLLFFKLDIVAIFERKKQEIIDTITKSENDKEISIKNLSETKMSVQNIDNDIKQIVANAEDMAKALMEKSELKLSEELETIKNRTVVLKDAQEAKAKEEVSSNIANAAIAISREYLKSSLGEDKHKELIYNFINDLDKMGVEK